MEAADPLGLMAADTEERRFTRFLLNEIKSVRSSDGIESLHSVSVPPLADKPTDFHSCVEKVTKLRRNLLVMRYNNDFKCTGHGDMARKIEVNASDPFKYFEELLRWLEKEISSEYGVVYNLLWPNHQLYTGPFEVGFCKIRRADFKMAERARTIVLNWTFEVFSVPIKVLVEQILRSQINLLTSYKISILLKKFINVMPEMDPRESKLGETVRELHEAAHLRFLNLLACHQKVLLEFSLPVPVPVDFSLPQEVMDEVSVLLDIIKIRDHYFISEEVLPSRNVISTLLNPILQICEQAMMALKSNGDLSISRNNPGQLQKSSVGAISAKPEVVFLEKFIGDFIQPLLKPYHGPYSWEFACELGGIVRSQLNPMVVEGEIISQICSAYIPYVPEGEGTETQKKRKQKF